MQAPMAGGPSTPGLAAAVCEAGGLGFLAAGYRSAEDLGEEVAALREQTSRPFGVNVFVPSGGPADPEVVAAYARRLTPLAEKAGVDLGEPRFEDDEFGAKCSALIEDPPAVVSFTFGCPEEGFVHDLHGAGAEVWVTVTDPEEAAIAAQAGVDALVVQGAEAGGHRGSFVDSPERVEYGLLALLQLVPAEVELPLIASGGIATGAGIAAVLAAGAVAAQLGTAFMLCPEAGTSKAHREAIASTRPTGLTRAFSGRLARGIVNRLQREHSDFAPLAYPQVHHLTSPLRAHGRKVGEEGLINLWAGEAHALAEARPAAEVVARIDREAREAL
ncbi:MAG TPA: nitronate monooxygenase [Solirubrobacterales bacterium]|nr:nitronate monooxygenase [Solirubrobacterales bacterium]